MWEKPLSTKVEIWWNVFKIIVILVACFGLIAWLAKTKDILPGQNSERSSVILSVEIDAAINNPDDANVLAIWKTASPKNWDRAVLAPVSKYGRKLFVGQVPARIPVDLQINWGSMLAESPKRPSCRHVKFFVESLGVIKQSQDAYADLDAAVDGSRICRFTDLVR